VRRRETTPLPDATPRSFPSLQEAGREMWSLVGLEKQKHLLREIYALTRIERERQKAGLKVERQSLHMVFHGNPGTGKTTVARLFGIAFHRIGLLQTGQFVEVGRADLVGEYIGHTAQRMRQAMRRAQGGVLFIDEAYALGRGGDRDFGREAIDTLVKGIEDPGSDLMVILAGYGHEMARFFDLNPGLESRIPLKVAFSDYGAEDLLRIACTMLAERDYAMSQDAKYFLGKLLQERTGQWQLEHGNARLIRSLMERAIRRQSVRLLEKTHPTVEDLRTISWADIQDSGLL